MSRKSLKPFRDKFLQLPEISIENVALREIKNRAMQIFRAGTGRPARLGDQRGGLIERHLVCQRRLLRACPER